MKNQRPKSSSDRPKKTSPHKGAPPLRPRSEERKAPQAHSGRVHRTPDGTIEENSEEAAP